MRALLLRIAKVEQQIGLAQSEVFGAYLKLLSVEELIALVDAMEIPRSQNMRSGFEKVLSTPPRWVDRNDLWNQAVAGVGGGLPEHEEQN